MSDKFKYAPGKPGFGSRGDTGEDGLPGLSMYFTDLDPVNEVNVINNKITNNIVLWSGDNTALPGGRVYSTGDLFFDTNGKCYEIDASANTFTYRLAELTMGRFFSALGVTSMEGFERYYNNNASPKYLIDNVYTTAGSVDYSTIPSTIYGIATYNFTRIEYTDVPLGGKYNAFTVYSAGETAPADDKEALAIVREYATNVFRIGNLDDSGDLRNVSLTFDVSLLKQTKETGNQFTINTSTGAILTNYEIRANSLFDNNFVANPSSFYCLLNGTTNEVSIYWNLLDFVSNDSDVTGDLYFFQTISSYDGETYDIDSSVLRPLVFYNVGSSGSIAISGLNAAASYTSYMKLEKNGWTRNSDPEYIEGASLTISPTTWQTDGSGAYEGDNSIGFNVISNTTWTPTLQTNPSTFMTELAYDGDSDGSIFVELEENSGPSRTGIIRVTLPNASYEDISIWQLGPGASSPPLDSVTFDISDGVDTVSGDCEFASGQVTYYITEDGLEAGYLIHLSTTLGHYVNVPNPGPAGATVEYLIESYLKTNNDTTIASYTSNTFGNPLSVGDSSSGFIPIEASIYASDFPIKIEINVTTDGYDVGNGFAPLILVEAGSGRGINFAADSCIWLHDPSADLEISRDYNQTDAIYIDSIGCGGAGEEDE